MSKRKRRTTGLPKSSSRRAQKEEARDKNRVKRLDRQAIDIPGWYRKNQYTCNKCGGSIITRDLDEGTTSFYLDCRATEGCEGRMISSVYRVDQSLTPTHEWYKPTGKIPAAARQHVAMGGLLIRPIEGWADGTDEGSMRIKKHLAEIDGKSEGAHEQNKY